MHRVVRIDFEDVSVSQADLMKSVVERPCRGSVTLLESTTGEPESAGLDAVGARHVANPGSPSPRPQQWLQGTPCKSDRT